MRKYFDDKECFGKVTYCTDDKDVFETVTCKRQSRIHLTITEILEIVDRHAYFNIICPNRNKL
jgi:hypothetical protein